MVTLESIADAPRNVQGVGTLPILRQIVDHFERTQQFVTRARTWPNTRGEYYCLCPEHDDARVGSFSFSIRGYKCFSCGAHGSIADLARVLGLIDFASSQATIIVQPRQDNPAINYELPPSWANLNVDRAFLDIPTDPRAYLYSRGFSDDTIDRWKLRWGVLPLSQCHHPRIILPVIDRGKLVAIRGRHFHCDCDPGKAKWLCSRGSKTVLFGSDLLDIGQAVIIAEAPFAAILAMQHERNIVAVAGTAGAATWRPEWGKRLIQAAPASVLVWFDNDLAGAPNPETYDRALTTWRQRNPRRELPEPNGPRVANELRRQGLRRVALWKWPPGTPDHFDLADWLLSQSPARVA